MVSFLDSGELAAAQADAEALLPGEATVQRLTRVSDGGGGFTDEWTDQATVAARIAPVGGGEPITVGRKSTIGGRIIDATTHVVTLPAGTDVLATDRLVIDGALFEVTLVRVRGALELVRRVEVKEVT